MIELLTSFGYAVLTLTAILGAIFYVCLMCMFLDADDGKENLIGAVMLLVLFLTPFTILIHVARMTP